MLEYVIAILVVLWLLGWIAVPAAGNAVHVLLVVVLVLLLVRFLRGRWRE